MATAKLILHVQWDRDRAHLEVSRELWPMFIDALRKGLREANPGAEIEIVEDPCPDIGQASGWHRA